jgi:3',5'-cyclic-AMP phosphodiesterase
MEEQSKKLYLWLTDTHLDKVLPWTLMSFILHLRKENPAGIFLTGDISNGLLTPFHLKLLARFIKCPIYFVLGNHDYHFNSIEGMHQKIREVCQEYPNLIWITQEKVIRLNEEIALIGTEGWFDAENGNPEYLRFTFDWFLIKDFWNLPNFKERIKKWREMADWSAQDIGNKLQSALDQDYKNVFILTHFPPFTQATRDVGSLLEKYWLPYNTNIRLGKAIEQVMFGRKKKHANIFCGHIHEDQWAMISRNVECKVQRAKYFGSLRNEEVIWI